MKKTIFFLFVFFLAVSRVEAQTDFYKGKQVKIVVGAAAGAVSDLYARTVAQYLPKHIPGNPDMIVQNMPGGGNVIAANYVYSIAKPDGLTLGAFLPAVYFEQLRGRKEVQFDWAKFAWIGSPEENDEVLSVRSDTPYKTLADIRKASEPPRCGSTGIGSSTYYFPKLLEDVFGVKFNVVTGYPGGRELDLAIERNEVQCRGGTINALFGRDPSRTWAKTGFIRMLVQGGAKRDHRLPDTPTIWELMKTEKIPEASRSVATVILSPGTFGRPIVGTPGIPADRITVLREAYAKMLQDPEFLADAKKRQWEINPISGERLEALAKEVINQPPEVIERMKKILGK
ncbi:MAG: hypothetical protein HYY45_12350 [Deltaproteobacteria bacterium]|nr:hypothetical protein [Deltaproteobacteria bacterium]